MWANRLGLRAFKEVQSGTLRLRFMRAFEEVQSGDASPTVGDATPRKSLGMFLSSPL
jgi:hypothetical protein